MVYVRVSNDLTLGGYFNLDCFNSDGKSIVAFSSSDGKYIEAKNNVYKAKQKYSDQLQKVSANTQKIIEELLQSGKYKVINK